MKIRHLIWAAIIFHLGILVVAAVQFVSSSATITEFERDKLKLNDGEKVTFVGSEIIRYPALSIVKDGKLKRSSLVLNQQGVAAYEAWRKKLSFLGYRTFFDRKWDAGIWTPHLIVQFSPDTTVFTPTAAPDKGFESFSRASTEEDKILRRLLLEADAVSPKTPALPER
ncbi:MAG TPA: hypothetical protein VK970_22055 [Candidatus Methylacidiphilales bacterium]|nr:hypothetical protein [Candidatus Methylacidiphilales bacterium]